MPYFRAFRFREPAVRRAVHSRLIEARKVWRLPCRSARPRVDLRLIHDQRTGWGSTRPTVSVVAATLQRGGLIQYKHGHITVLDRLGLEQASCECYETVRARFDQLGL